MILPSGPDPLPISDKLIPFCWARVCAAGLARTLPELSEALVDETLTGSLWVY